MRKPIPLAIINGVRRLEASGRTVNRTRLVRGCRAAPADIDRAVCWLGTKRLLVC